MDPEEFDAPFDLCLEDEPYEYDEKKELNMKL